MERKHSFQPTWLLLLPNNNIDNNNTFLKSHETETPTYLQQVFKKIFSPIFCVKYFLHYTGKTSLGDVINKTTFP